MYSPSALIRVNYLVMRFLHFRSARGDLQERRTWPGNSLIWRRYGGGVSNRCRWADRFAMSEQQQSCGHMQSMERHFQRSRELFRTDRGRPCPREWKDPQAKRCGRMERSGSLCGRGYRSAEAAAAASGSNCQRKCRCEGLSGSSCRQGSISRQGRHKAASGSGCGQGRRKAASGRDSKQGRSKVGYG